MLDNGYKRQPFKDVDNEWKQAKQTQYKINTNVWVGLLGLINVPLTFYIALLVENGLKSDRFLICLNVIYF